MKLSIAHESKLIQGHVMDVSVRPLLAALRRYDRQLYVRWNAKKRGGLGLWELRRKPEFKSVQAGRMVESPRGKVLIPGDVFEMDWGTLCVPSYHENHMENHVKDFLRLDYSILDWVAGHDAWNYGYRGKNLMAEAEYREAKYLEKIDEDSYAEKQYMIKQNKTAFEDFREYVLSGGDPSRLMEYWGKQ